MNKFSVYRVACGHRLTKATSNFDNFVSPLTLKNPPSQSARLNAARVISLGVVDRVVVHAEFSNIF